MRSRSKKTSAPGRMVYLVSRHASRAYSVILQEARRLAFFGVDMQVLFLEPNTHRLYRLTLESNAERALVLYTCLGSLPRSAWGRFVTWLRGPLACLRGVRAARQLPVMDVSGAGRLRREVELAVALSAWLHREGFTHVHVQSTSPSSRLAFLMKAVAGLGYSLTLNGPDSFAVDRHPRLRAEIEGAMFVRCLGRYGRVALRRLVPAAQDHKLEVVPPGVDTLIYQPVVFRHRPRPCEIVSVGRLEAAKGQATLIAACADLLIRGHDLRLRLIGDGPDRAWLQARVARLGLADRVVFEGKIDPIGLRRYYLRADIVALASATAGLPVALMEAMAMAIPCVSTTAPGLAELIRSERDGLLVPPGAAGRLADALERLLVDADLRRRLGQAGLARVLERFALESCAQALSAMLARHLGRGTPRGRSTPAADLPPGAFTTTRERRRPTPSVRRHGRHRDHDLKLLAALAA